MRLWKKKVETVPVLDDRTKRLLELTDKLAREDERELLYAQTRENNATIIAQAHEIATLRMAQAASRGMLIAARDE